MEKIVSLCKRRGFVFPNSEIYSGFGSTWDFGPLGVELERNITAAWWREIVHRREDVVGLDSAILMAPVVWRASGHLEHFTDPLVECKRCHHRFRADEIGARCPDCGGELTEARQFNTMFKTFVGPVEEEATVAYLRPETCQGIFVNFKLVQQAARKKLPFGIAQIGKAFRNEITTGNFLFRLRELQQMELEYFVYPGTDEEWHARWIEERRCWHLKLGLRPENLRLYPHPKEKLSHYSKATTDIMYRFPFGWGELEGIANRTDYDLRQHSSYSGRDLEYFDEETKEHVVPYVIEPSVGVDRTFLALVCDAYDEEPDKGGVRTVLHLHPALAPVKAAVFPLLRNDERLVNLAREVFAALREEDHVVQYDETGAIGRRYRRQDEIGTPFCITIDHQSLEDGTVTVRERDSMAQERLASTELTAYLWPRVRFPK
jgi:glycyl-tRNA synthetase